MVSYLKVINSFLIKADEEFRDSDGTPFKQKKIDISKDKALEFMKKLYPEVKISMEPMAGGLAYYGKFSAGVKMIGNYSFGKRELWFKIYPGTKVPYFKS